MSLNPAVLDRMVQVGVQRQWAEVLQGRGSPNDIMRLAMSVPSTRKVEKYAWLQGIPAVREWIGEKRAKQLADYSFEINNADFEATIPIDRNDLDDDATGSFDIMIRLLVDAMSEKPRSLLSGLVTNGTSGKAFDGVAFFSNTSGARTIDNLLAGTGVTVSALATDLDSVIQAMMAFTDEASEPLNIVPDTIYCPPALVAPFQRLVYSGTDPTASAQGTFNPFGGGKFTVIGDARLASSDANDWYAFKTNGVLKPFIWQERSAPKGVLDDTRVKATRMYYASAEMRGNVGYGLPHLAVKVVNT